MFDVFAVSSRNVENAKSGFYYGDELPLNFTPETTVCELQSTSVSRSIAEYTGAGNTNDLRPSRAAFCEQAKNMISASRDASMGIDLPVLGLVIQT